MLTDVNPVPSAIDEAVGSMMGCDDIVSMRKSRDDTSEGINMTMSKEEETIPTQLHPAAYSSEAYSAEYSAGSVPENSYRPSDLIKLTHEH